MTFFQWMGQVARPETSRPFVAPFFGLDSWFLYTFPFQGETVLLQLHPMVPYQSTLSNQPISIIGYQSMPYPFNQKSTASARFLRRRHRDEGRRGPGQLLMP